MNSLYLIRALFDIFVILNVNVILYALNNRSVAFFNFVIYPASAWSAFCFRQSIYELALYISESVNILRANAETCPGYIAQTTIWNVSSPVSSTRLNFVVVGRCFRFLSLRRSPLDCKRWRYCCCQVFEKLNFLNSVSILFFIFLHSASASYKSFSDRILFLKYLLHLSIIIAPLWCDWIVVSK